MGLNEEELPDIVEQIKRYIESPEFLLGDDDAPEPTPEGRDG